MFKKIILSQYVIVAKEWSNDTYWSCFGFEDEIPDDLHCTHKYFGEQDADTIKEITQVLDDHFKEEPFKDINAVFDEEDFFGEDKDVRVLSLAEDEDKNKFLLDLRSKLDAFAEDRHPEYKPHVTTDLPIVDKPLTRYCFCQGDNILKEWGST